MSSVASSEHAGNPAQRSQAYCYRGTNCESGHTWATAQDAKRGLPTQSGNRKYFRLAVRARLRNQRAPGAQREGEGKGKIERRGTRRYEKGVCTWGWPSTAEVDGVPSISYPAQVWSFSCVPYAMGCDAPRQPCRVKAREEDRFRVRPRLPDARRLEHTARTRSLNARARLLSAHLRKLVGRNSHARNGRSQRPTRRRWTPQSLRGNLQSRRAKIRATKRHEA